MGMMMLSPVMVSMPFKLLLFVLVDGWGLLIGSLVEDIDDDRAAESGFASKRSKRSCWLEDRSFWSVWLSVFDRLFQAVTQLQEMTITYFYTKIIAVFVTLLLMLPFMARSMMGFTKKYIREHSALRALSMELMYAGKYLCRPIHPVFIRVATMFVFIPYSRGEMTPILSRIGIILALTLLLLPVVEVRTDNQAAALFEAFFVGTALGLCAKLILGAVEMAAQWISVEMEIGVAAVFNPQFGEVLGPLSLFYTFLSMGLFFYF